MATAIFYLHSPWPVPEAEDVGVTRLCPSSGSDDAVVGPRARVIADAVDRQLGSPRAAA